MNSRLAPEPLVPRTEEAQLLEWYRAANERDSNRIWEFCEDCAKNGLDPEHEEAKRFNARQIALYAAYCLDTDEEATQNPEEFEGYQGSAHETENIVR